MKRKFTTSSLPSWFQNAKGIIRQFAIPFCVFQGVRTLLFPTAFDVLLLAIFILIATGLQLEWF